MKIKKMEVEGGLLNGLEISFPDSLSVLIGGRGTGKTSIIELIRYVFGVGSILSAVDRSAKDQAISILKDGLCTMTYERDGDEFFISRDSEGNVSGDVVARDSLPLIFSQTEIESIGVDQKGRLRLVDDFDPIIATLLAKEKGIQASLVSIADELSSMRSKVGGYVDALQVYHDVDSLLAIKLGEQAEISGRSSEAGESSSSLSVLNEKSVYISEKIRISEVKQEEITAIKNDIARVMESPILALNLIGIGDEFDAPFESRLEKISTYLKKALDEMVLVEGEIRSYKASLDKELAPIQKSAREQRMKLAAVDQRAADIARIISDLEKKKSEKNSLEKLLVDLTKSKDALNGKRDLLVRGMRENRSEIFKRRKDICEHITSSLAPNVEAKVLQAVRTEEYEEAIVSTLKGSGLKYNEIATVIAKSVSPQELLELCERGDYQGLSSATSIGEERCSRLVNSFNDLGIEKILASVIEDDIQFGLLDGRDFRSMASLSIGQRCTVVLSIVFLHQERVVVVDQPEDHLDNKFVANTLVESIRSREGGQTIISSHNANIPVLGDAKKVVLMESDGCHLFAERQGSLEDPEIVSDISNVMEGGAEAFSARAKFYHHG